MRKVLESTPAGSAKNRYFSGFSRVFLNCSKAILKSGFCKNTGFLTKSEFKFVLVGFKFPAARDKKSLGVTIIFWLLLSKNSSFSEINHFIKLSVAVSSFSLLWKPINEGPCDVIILNRFEFWSFWGSGKAINSSSLSFSYDFEKRKIFGFCFISLSLFLELTSKLRFAKSTSDFLLFSSHLSKFASLAKKLKLFKLAFIFIVFFTSWIKFLSFIWSKLISFSEIWLWFPT
ncbi:hypothetical protein MFC_00001 [Mesomycoplasma flocculare ATCC 27716]|nr:hypothetical protein MFC_00001 [Mesomycoplasma flocculare ATCC 27716]